MRQPGAFHHSTDRGGGGDWPEKLILDDGGSFRAGCGVLLAGLAWMTFIFAIALAYAGAALPDLALPLAALCVFWLAWTAIHVISGLFHRRACKRDILRLFAGEIWQCCRFEAGEWREVVEAELRAALPKRASALRGAVYSTLAGLVPAAGLVAAGALAVKNEMMRAVFNACAAGVVLLFASVGLFQPLRESYLSRRRRRRALRVARPRLWFTGGGVYHEAFGYTSLKELVRVRDKTRMDGTVEFIVRVRTVMGGAGDVAETEHLQPELFAMPAACLERAAELVRRYRLLLADHQVMKM